MNLLRKKVQSKNKIKKVRTTAGPQPSNNLLRKKVNQEGTSEEMKE